MTPPAPGFTASQIRVIRTQPYKWITPPTYNPDGSILTAGVKSAPLDGVHILLDDQIVEWLKIALTAAQKTALQSYVKKLYTDEDTNPARPVDDRLATWIGLVGWSGQTEHTFIRIPANIWNTPTSQNPPAAVKTFIQKYWQA